MGTNKNETIFKINKTINKCWKDTRNFEKIWFLTKNSFWDYSSDINFIRKNIRTHLQFFKIYRVKINLKTFGDNFENAKDFYEGKDKKDNINKKKKDIC